MTASTTWRWTRTPRPKARRGRSHGRRLGQAAARGKRLSSRAAAFLADLEPNVLAPVSAGVPFLGLRIWPGLTRLDSRRKLRELEMGLANGDLSEKKARVLAKSNNNSPGNRNNNLGFRLASSRPGPMTALQASAAQSQGPDHRPAARAASHPRPRGRR